MIEESTYPTPDPYVRSAIRAVIPAAARDVNDGLTTLRMLANDPNPYREMMGSSVEVEKDGRIRGRIPASEWFCLFSRSIASGQIVSAAHGAGAAAALVMLQPGESLAILNLSVSLYQSIEADGSAIRIEASSVRHRPTQLVASVSIFDAKGTLAAAGRVVGVSIDTSRRQKHRATEGTRVLATLLYTDIVGSTDHAKHLGDARWKTIIEQHHNLVRNEIARFGGVEVDTAGDSFFVRFESPGRALQCARALRSVVAGLGIEMRIGIHAGECELQRQRLVGLAVHIAARIQSLAAPGEVLVSSTIKDLAVGSAFGFADRGHYALKGIPGEWHLFALAD